MNVRYPLIGHWFRRPNGALLEVVAVDEDQNTVEVQYFDGTIDEIDFDTWQEQFLIEVAAPDDWLGSVDMDPDDYVGLAAGEMPAGFHDPLAVAEEE